MKNSTQIFLYCVLSLFVMMLISSISSCSVVEDYQYKGEETICGNIKYDFQIHEHFNDIDNTPYCFYYHDTIVEEWEITIDNIIKTKKLVWYKK